jgi:hypothetical protein
LDIWLFSVWTGCTGTILLSTGPIWLLSHSLKNLPLPAIPQYLLQNAARVLIL